MKNTNLDHPLKRHFPTRSAAEELLVRAHTSAQAQHSPLPWKEITIRGESASLVIASENGDIICEINKVRSEYKANAALIVRACNNAQRLADALRRIASDHHNRSVCVGIAREALAGCSEQV